MIRRREQGAAAVFAGISLLALLASFALVVDIGSLYFAQRDLQNKANLAALDTARTASGCYGAAAEPFDAALDSLERNGAPREWLQRAQVGTSRTGADGLRRFQPVGIASPFAVEVRLERAPPRRIFGNNGDRRRLRATAAAGLLYDAEPSVGSFMARIRPAAGLQPPPGIAAVIDVLAYNALAEVQTDLLGLTEDGLVETLTEMLTEEIRLPNFLDLIGDALRDTGDVAAASAVDTVSEAADAAGMAGPLVPAQLFDMEEDVAPLLNGLAVSVADLMQAAVQDVLVNGALELLIELGGGRQVELIVIERQRTVPGPPGLDEQGEPVTEAVTAQVRLAITLPISGVLPGTDPLRVYVDAARARAGILALRCPRAGRPVPEALVRSSTTAAHLSVEPVTVSLALQDLQGLLGLTDGQLLGLVGAGQNLTCALGGVLGGLGSNVCNLLNANPLLDVGISMPRVELSGAREEEYWVPGPFPSDPEPIGASPGDFLAGVTLRDLEVDIRLAGGALPTGVLANLVEVLDPLLEGALQGALGPLLDALLADLLDQLGISLAGADVRVHSANIRQPQLFLTVGN